MTDEAEKYISNYLEQLTYADEAELAFMRKYLSVICLKKGEFYLQNGEVQTNMGFLHHGLLRRFYVNEKGSEITTGFTKEQEYATDYPAFIRQKPTKYFMQCLEPTVIVNLPYEVIMQSYSNSKNSEKQGRLIAEKVLTILSDRVEGFLFNTAEERYLNFIAENPNLMNRISLTHLASFLGIERQSLSRIRKKIASK